MLAVPHPAHAPTNSPAHHAGYLVPLAQPLTSHAAPDAQRPPIGRALPFVERRGQGRTQDSAEADAAESAQRLGQVLDLLDYGLVLVGHDGQVQHCNRAARQALDDAHPLQISAGMLHARSAQDAGPLREAIGAAALRGFRRLLALGRGTHKSCVAVLPLPPLGPDAASAAGADHGVALLLARREVCEQLTVEWFARSHGLTMAETMVVKGLCADRTPQQIAVHQGVGLATVRTQIGSARLKTGAASIPALLRQVSLLPPMVGVLQGLLGRTTGGGALHS